MAILSPIAPLSLDDLIFRVATLPSGDVRDTAVRILESDYGIDPSLMPPPRDPEIQAFVDACRWDVELFAREFFPESCTVPFSPMHYDFFYEWRQQRNERGKHEARAAPRGAAKTTIRGFIKPIHDILYRHETYILIISSRAELAEEKVKSLRDELDLNERLLEVYGYQKTTEWNQSDFVSATGVRVKAASPKSQIRGLLWRGRHRPTKVLLDDAESSEHVLSILQREKFYEWYMSDVSKIGAPHTNFEVIGTVLHEDAALSRLMRNPGYTSRRYQAVLAFNENVSLWQKWREIFIDLSNPDRMRDARAFFEEHESEMTDGAQVLWPERESYYDLMVMRLVEGDDAFWKEKQNDPSKASTYPFHDAVMHGGYFAVEPAGILRRDGRYIGYAQLTKIIMFWDPALGLEHGRSDYSCAVILAQDVYGFYYVLDCYLGRDEPPDKQVVQIAWMCYRWRVSELGLERNGFQSLLRSDLEEALFKLKHEEGVEPYEWLYAFTPLQNTKSKSRRIMAIQPLIANRWLWFADNLPDEFYRQFREFRPIENMDFDDAPDAVESGIRVAKGLIDSRAAHAR